MSTGEILGVYITAIALLVTVGIAYGVVITRLSAHDELDTERHANVQAMFEEIRTDVKTLLSR